MIRFRSLAALLSLLLLWPAAALAGAEGNAAQAVHFDWWALLGRIFNSTVLFGTLIVLLRKPLIRLLSRQSLEIKADIEGRETHLVKQTADLQAVSAKLEAIEQEIRQLLREADEAGRSEIARLNEAGEREARRIRELTESEIEQRVASATQQLRARIADLVVENFKQDVAGALTPAIQRRIIEKNIQKAGEIDAGK